MSDSYASDIAYIQDLLGPLRGSQIGEVEVALGENRDGVIKLAERIARDQGLVCPPAVFSSSVRKAEHTRRQRVTDNNNEETAPRVRVPAAEAMRRLYDAKVSDLTRMGVRDPERTTIAVDYACSEVHRCQILPMPPGGVGKLEDDLYASLGMDRVSGVRFPPRNHADASSPSDPA